MGPNHTCTHGHCTHVGRSLYPYTADLCGRITKTPKSQSVRITVGIAHVVVGAGMTVPLATQILMGKVETGLRTVVSLCGPHSMP